MKSTPSGQGLSLENYWGQDVSPIREEVLQIWNDHRGPVGDAALQRLRQIVFVVKTPEGGIAGLSTAFKVYVKQLRNHLFAIRLLLLPAYRVPGLTSKLLVSTRDFLESIHREDPSGPAIGVITLVENPRIKTHRNEAIWPASRMVYIGNSDNGHHIRVYYFKGARITP